MLSSSHSALCNRPVMDVVAVLSSPVTWAVTLASLLYFLYRYNTVHLFVCVATCHDQYVARYGTSNHTYFSDQGIPGPKPLPYVGNLWGLWTKAMRALCRVWFLVESIWRCLPFLLRMTEIDRIRSSVGQTIRQSAGLLRRLPTEPLDHRCWLDSNGVSQGFRPFYRPQGELRWIFAL